MSHDESETRSAWSLWRRNLVIWAALLALLTLTLMLAYAPLGAMSIVVALGIATAKASLVLLLFMELRTSSNLVRLAAAAGAIWLLVLFLLTVSDYVTRVGS
jgi:cytochrome c oxidase subunit 4